MKKLNHHRKKTTPIKKQEEVYQHPDNKIDQDFPGFPHGQSKENLINPVSHKDKKTAAVQTTDGEKMNQHSIDEIQSDASGTAFDRTETVQE